jgi:ataxia telangiectasia mutated family protein
MRMPGTRQATLAGYFTDLECRFRPNDLHPQRFRKDMGDLQCPRPPKQPAPATELIRKFKENMKHYKPVMRHFFTDMRNDPIGWYSMRLKYARSVAVGSMVGHLVGLGDRHCSNIMINTQTGEILHIDLGIAFDQVGVRWRYGWSD